MRQTIILTFVEYIVITFLITIDPYETKGKKRIKRFIKMMLWLITAGILYNTFEINQNIIFFLIIACFFCVKYLLDIINPYLGFLFYATTIYFIIGYLFYVFLYPKHKVVAGIGMLVLILVTISVWKEQLAFMLKGLDADIEAAKEEEDKRENKKRKKRIKKFFKTTRFFLKRWKI